MEISFALVSGSKKCCWDCSLRLGKYVCCRHVWERKPALSRRPWRHTSVSGGFPSAARRARRWGSYKYWQGFFLILGGSLTCYTCVDNKACNKTTVCSVNFDTCLWVKAGKSLPLPCLLKVLGWGGPGRKCVPCSFSWDLYSTSNGYHLRDKNKSTLQDYSVFLPSTTKSFWWHCPGMLNVSGKLIKGLGDAQVQKNPIERRKFISPERRNPSISKDTSELSCQTGWSDHFDVKSWNVGKIPSPTCEVLDSVGGQVLCLQETTITHC